MTLKFSGPVPSIVECFLQFKYEHALNIAGLEFFRKKFYRVFIAQLGRSIYATANDES